MKKYSNSDNVHKIFRLIVSFPTLDRVLVGLPVSGTFK